MDVSGELHAPAPAPPDKQPHIPNSLGYSAFVFVITYIKGDSVCPWIKNWRSLKGAFLVFLNLTYQQHKVIYVSKQFIKTSPLCVKYFNLLTTKRNLLYIRNQSVPRSKLSTTVIITKQLLMYKAKVAVCSDIRTKHSTQSERQVEFLIVKPGGT